MNGAVDPAADRDGDRVRVEAGVELAGLLAGAGSDYEAQRMASQGKVVVVTANARLGIFGYFGLPGMRGGGDFGFADQIAALRWAKANAQAFGGDPDNITVVGESSGGMSTCALLTSPAARGLVEKAAISSGSCLLNWPQGGLVLGGPAQTPYASVQVNRGLSTAIAKQLGCRGASAAACMRNLPARQLVSKSIDFSDVLAYGTPLLPHDPAAAVRAGQIAHIPILSGGNRDEERSFLAAALDAKPSLITHQTYPMLLAQAFKANARAVAKQYPLDRYPSPGLALASVTTDASWACPTLAGNQLMSKVTTVYPYEFVDETAPNVTASTACLRAPRTPQTRRTCSTSAARTYSSRPRSTSSPARWWPTGRASRTPARPAEPSKRPTASRRSASPRPGRGSVTSRPSTTAASGAQSAATRPRGGRLITTFSGPSTPPAGSGARDSGALPAAGQSDLLKKPAMRRCISSGETFSMRWLSIHCWP